MELSLIQKYMKFAIDNGYDLLDSYNETGSDFWDDIKNDLDKNLSETARYAILNVISVKVITSYSFIEAVVNGLLKNNENKNSLKIGRFFADIKRNNYNIEDTIELFTTEQSIFIRDGKTDDFINIIFSNNI